MKNQTILSIPRKATYAALVLALLMFGLAGCGDPLEVENPNSLVEQDLSNPIAANGIANGALATTAQGIAYVLAPYLAATDEVTWIGSRDDWRNLDFGNVSDANNEFTDNAMKFLHEGRWMSDKGILQLEEFDKNNELPNRSDLARVYLYAALARVYIADWFDDWTFSDKTVPFPPVGEDNMDQVYRDAIDLLDKAIAVAQQEGNTALETQAVALRARAQHALAVWGLLNPKGSTPANPWVNAGKADAEKALSMMGDDNYRWQLFYAPGAEWNDFAWQVNGRLELGIVADPTIQKPELHVPIMDPVDNIPDPRVLAIIEEFRDTARWSGTNYSPLTVVSGREMRLIIAEAELASGNPAGALAQINAIRALDGLTPVTDQITVEDALKHERRANLILTGRRLADMYRFGIKDPLWQSTSDAFTTPGSFLPITISEIQSNPCVNNPTAPGCGGQ